MSVLRLQLNRGCVVISQHLMLILNAFLVCAHIEVVDIYIMKHEFLLTESYYSLCELCSVLKNLLSGLCLTFLCGRATKI